MGISQCLWTFSETEIKSGYDQVKKVLVPKFLFIEINEVFFGE